MPHRALYIAWLVVTSLGGVELASWLLFSDFADTARFRGYRLNRVVSSQVSVGTDGYDRELGFANSPNLRDQLSETTVRYRYSTNSLGFRSRETTSPGAAKRILLLGDSFFWGHVSDDELISAHMERAKATWDVFNYGVHGYNTVQEYAVWRKFGRRVAADDVVLGFFTGNDPLANWLASISPEYEYGYDPERRVQIQEWIDSSYGVLWHSTAFRVVSGRVILPRVRYQLSRRVEVVQHSVNWIEKLGREAMSSGATFRVLLIHPKDAVDGGVVARWTQSRRFGNEFQRALLNAGMTVVDLLDYMDGHAAVERYFLPRDSHFNAEGNRFVAEILTQEIAGVPASTEHLRE